MISNNSDLLDEEMKPRLVSVIIPTHNRPAYLEQAVSSVLNQTHKAIEIIIVDDGSDKRHTEAIDRIAGLGPAIGLHRHETPKGPGYARNFGLDKATGEFVLFLDDDDLLRPSMVDDGLTQFQRYPDSDVVVCAARAFSQSEASGAICLDKNRQVADSGTAMQLKPSALIDLSDLQRIIIPIDACLVRRQTIGSIRFPEDLLVGEDTFFWLSLKHQGGAFRYHDKVNVLLRRHPSNSTGSKRRYYRQIQNYQCKLLKSGMLTRRKDIALVKVQLAYFKFRQNPMAGLLNCGQIFKNIKPVLKALGLFLYDRLRKQPRSFWRYF